MNRDETIKKRIETLKAKKGFQQAYERVKNNHNISTGDLEYFGISFESFLKYAQLPKTQCAKIIDNLLNMFN
jgi:hypothetical protein